MAANVLESIDALFADGAGAGAEASIAPIEESTEAPKPKTHATELEDLDKFIEDEMEKRKTAIGMTWRKLDKCFKWKALKEHLVSLGFAPADELYKRVETLLKSNDLSTTVEYNREEKKITQINHPDLSLMYK